MTAEQLGFDAEIRNQVLDRALAHADDEWASLAYKAIATLAATGRVFQATDLVALGVPEPDHKNRWGAIVRAAAAQVLIEHVGYAPSNRHATQGSITKTWRGADSRPPSTDAADRLRALSLARPWAGLVLHNGKDIENRSWSTHYRGPLVIHASKTARTVRLPRGREVDGRVDPTGFVGVVDLVAVCDAKASLSDRRCDCGIWAEAGAYHWQITNPRSFPRPLPGNGRLQLFAPPLHVADLALRVAASTNPEGMVS